MILPDTVMDNVEECIFGFKDLPSRRRLETMTIL